MPGQFIDWTEEHSFDGTFYLPGTPERRTQGRLRLKAGNWPVLDTFDVLIHGGPEKAESVHGLTREGELTLIGCVVVRADTFAEPGFRGQSIVCDAVLFDDHVSPSALLRRLVLRFTNLQRLVPSKLWESNKTTTPGGSNARLTYHFQTSRHLASAEHGGTRVDVFVYAPVEQSFGGLGNHLTVKPQVDVIVEFPSQVSLVDAKQFWTDLALLWSLLTGTRSDVVAALASQHAPDLQEPRHAHHDFEASLVGSVRSDAATRQSFGDFFYDLTAGSYPTDLSNVLAVWLGRRDSLRVAAKLLVDTWDRDLSWEAKLGIVAQALEAFHRSSTHPQTFVPDADYAQVQSGLVGQVNGLTRVDGLRTSLKKRVEFGNQVSLRRRTRDLMRGMPPALRDAFGKWQGVVDEMVDARNALIHRDPTSPVPPFREIVRVTGHFGLTLHSALLQAIGVPDAAIANRLQMQPPYQEWLSYRR